MTWEMKSLMHQPWMGEMFRATVANTQRDIRDLIALTEVGKKVRLATWERRASSRRVTASGEGLLLCEVNLFPLLTTILGSMTLPAMMGKAFGASPTALEDIDVPDDSLRCCPWDYRVDCLSRL